MDIWGWVNQRFAASDEESEKEDVESEKISRRNSLIPVGSFALQSDYVNRMEQPIIEFVNEIQLIDEARDAPERGLSPKDAEQLVDSYQEIIRKLKRNAAEQGVFLTSFGEISGMLDGVIHEGINLDISDQFRDIQSDEELRKNHLLRSSLADVASFFPAHSTRLRDELVGEGGILGGFNVIIDEDTRETSAYYSKAFLNENTNPFWGIIISCEQMIKHSQELMDYLDENDRARRRRIGLGGLIRLEDIERNEVRGDEPSNFPWRQVQTKCIYCHRDESGRSYQSDDWSYVGEVRNEIQLAVPRGQRFDEARDAPDLSMVHLWWVENACSCYERLGRFAKEERRLGPYRGVWIAYSEITGRWKSPWPECSVSIGRARAALALDRVVPDQMTLLVFWFLYAIEHELFHYKTEMSASKLDAGSNDDDTLYLKYWERAKPNREPCFLGDTCFGKRVIPHPQKGGVDLHYCDYRICVCLGKKHTKGYQFPLEEALANAISYKHRKKCWKKAAEVTGLNQRTGSNQYPLELDIALQNRHRNDTIGYSSCFAFSGFRRPVDSFRRGCMALTAMIQGKGIPAVNAYIDMVYVAQNTKERRDMHILGMEQEKQIVRGGNLVLDGFESVLSRDEKQGLGVPLLILADDDKYNKVLSRLLGGI